MQAPFESQVKVPLTRNEAPKICFGAFFLCHPVETTIPPTDSLSTHSFLEFLTLSREMIYKRDPILLSRISPWHFV